MDIKERTRVYAEADAFMLNLILVSQVASLYDHALTFYRQKRQFDSLKEMSEIQQKYFTCLCEEARQGIGR